MVMVRLVAVKITTLLPSRHISNANDGNITKNLPSSRHGARGEEFSALLLQSKSLSTPGERE
jgi:hypothetical protein